MKAELLGRIDKLEHRVDGNFENLNNKINQVEDNLTERMDKLGLQIARLEDDTPTRDEFDNLQEIVTKLEQATPSI